MSVMTLSLFRKSYPFIAYGDEYKRWKRAKKWYKWLFDRLHTEGPTEYTCHDWRKLHFKFECHLEKFNEAFKALPKPTREQYNSDYDPLVVGKWPEDAIDLLEKFILQDTYCREDANEVAAILTKNDYQVNVLKMKQYESNKVKYGKKKK